MCTCLKMANSIFVVFVAVFLLQIGTGKDIRWIRNSNWNNVDNWSLGRLPCKGDIASFSQVKPINGQRPVIYFNTNSTVRRLVLPRNGRIVLKPSITIQLAANESCEISSNTVPMVATESGEMNNFIGVRANKWECPENWVADDNSLITHAPCGSDVPVLPSDSAFSYITSAMGMIYVNSVSLGAQEPPDLDSFDDELLLNLSVNSDCQSNPNLCPCIQVDNDCNVLASTALPTVTPTTSSASLAVSSSVTTMVEPSAASSSALSMPSSSAAASSMSSSSVAASSMSLSSISSMTSLSISSLFTSSSSPVISIPGNVGVTSSTSVPIPHITEPIGPIGTAGVTHNDDDDGGMDGAVMIGAVVGVIVVLLIIIIIIVVISIIVVRKRRYKETKHSHLEEDDHTFATKESGTAAYDNPVYELNLSTELEQPENPLF